MPLIKYNNQSLSSITTLPASIPTGKLKLISSQTASNSASISFTTGLNSTYKIYKFVFVNIHPRTDGVQFQFQTSTNGGSSYGVTNTSTAVDTYHDESDSTTWLRYVTSADQAQSTAYQRFSDGGVGNGADESISGSMTLFNPSSTTYVKHWISRFNNYYSSDASMDNLFAGYFNTTSAINAIDFKMSSGNFDGTIYLYAIDNS